MKAQVRDVNTSPSLSSLHRKSTSAIGRHSGHRAHPTTATTAAELAAAITVSPSSNASEEMQIYFSKLKELVPFMPRNRKLSKLEIIQYVIDYICDLQLALESQPLLCSHAAAAAALSLGNSPNTVAHRQPLGVINTSNGPNSTCAVQEATLSSSSSSHHHRHNPLPQYEKSPLVDNPCASC